MAEKEINQINVLKSYIEIKLNECNQNNKERSSIMEAYNQGKINAYLDIKLKMEME